MNVCSRTLACAVFAALPFTPAAAEIITFRFDGTITSNEITSGPWSFADPGDAFAVEYSFESTTPDSDPSATLGNYGDCMTAFTVVGGTSFETGTEGGILVTNSVGDGYQVGLTMAGGLAAFIQLGDASATALDSDLMPTNINFDDWSGRRFSITTWAMPGPTLVGEITSFTLVPAPAAAAFFSAGLLGLARRRR